MPRPYLHSTPLLIVEDSDEDFYALSRVLKKLGLSNPVQRCENGDSCLALLKQSANRSASPAQHAAQTHGAQTHGAQTHILPGFILMDLNLPGTDGRDTIQALKTHPQLKDIPIAVLTTSANPRDVATCYAFGVNAYVLKPLDYDDLIDTLRTVTDFWLRVAVLPTVSALQ